MIVEIISIGDELLIGQTVNTNASWMGEKLVGIGAKLCWVTTVGDNAAHIMQALQLAESRADVILLTGGLGPTHDDITKKIIAEYFQSELVMDENVLQQVKERFRNRRIPMAPINREQALVPDKARVVENKLGTAPGLYLQKDEKHFYVMPGVPREMQGMMHAIILPELQQLVGNFYIQQKTLVTSGIAESTLFQKLGVEEIEKFAKVAFLPDLSGVKIRLTASSENKQAALKDLAHAETLVRERAGEFIYADHDTNLPNTIADLLLQKGQTLAVAESCTGGLVANKLTDISGSSAWFERGVVTYSNAAKMQLLGVPEALLQDFGAVSAQVAEKMAQGVRALAQTDYGISITGIAGPTGGTAEKPVGLVYIACADAHSTVVEEHHFFNDRLANKERSAFAVLNLLRKKIIG